MTPDSPDAALVRGTRPLLAAEPDRAASAFYAALFEDAPGLRSLFPADMTEQGRKLAATLALAADAAGDWERLGPVLDALARRHLAYGVRPEHYPPVGRALLKTLRASGASAAEAAAWSRLYDAVAARMIAAAHPACAAQAPMARAG